jgi:hypothetical protein
VPCLYKLSSVGTSEMILSIVMKRIRPYMLITLLCIIYVAYVLARNGGDPLALVTLGTRFSENVPAEQGGTEGYDGQFVYYIARDPSNAAQFIDAPAYRFQRILLPALGMVLSFGQTSLIPFVLLIVNLISLAAGTALLERLLVERGVSRWYAIGYGLALGTFGAVRLSVPEPLAYALTIGGVALALRDRWLFSAVLFALAGLAKETTLIVAAGAGLHLLYRRQWRDALIFGIVSLLPFIIWQWILFQHFGDYGVGSGGAMATPFEIIPFMGVVRILTEGGPAVFSALMAILLPFVLIPTLWALYRAWRDVRSREINFYTALMFTTALIMLFVPFSTYREPIGILRFIVGLQMAVILYAAHKRNTRVLRNSTLWMLTALFGFSLV